MLGNPNPSPETRFKPGVSGNPGGKTAKQRKLEVKNAERSTRIRSQMLKALENSILNAEDQEQAEKIAAELIQTAVLKLMKDAEDRGLGTPVATVEHTGKDGGAIETTSATDLEVARHLAFILEKGARNG